MNEVAGGKVPDLKPNSDKIIQFGNKLALLARVSNTEWKAFSAICTHLNCMVQIRSRPTDLVCLP
jgi:nitrite reductase/ring-hydroxylating ferredoxin subunit